MRHLLLPLVPAALVLFATAPGRAQVIVGMGDSVMVGVQSGELNAPTQLVSFTKLIATQAGDPLPLPLVTGGPFTVTTEVTGHFRLNPNLHSRQLAFSGAEVRTLLTDIADLTLDTEADLMLGPRIGNMVDIAETIDSDLIFCFLGGNDLLEAVLAIDQLDGSQVTPEATFETVFTELAERLGALDADVVYGNIPSIDRVAFVMNNEELTAFTGTNHNLPAGYLTTLPTAMLLKFGLEDSSILSDPGYVLDPGEISVLQARTAAFNQIIAEQAAANGAVVVDVAAQFADLDESGYAVIGKTLTTGFNGGLFSLDGIHPSNTGHAIFANSFIEAANDAYGWNIPKLSDAQIALTAFFDPYVDKDNDGRVTGRAFNGLIETLMPVLGYSGDPNDLIPSLSLTVEKQAGLQMQAGLSRRQQAVKSIVDLYRTR